MVLHHSLHALCAGAVNISYEVISGALSDLSQVEGALAEPGQDFVSTAGSVVLGPGQSSVAVPVSILDVSRPRPSLFVHTGNT